MKVTDTSFSRPTPHIQDSRDDAPGSLRSGSIVSRCEPSDACGWSALISRSPEVNLGHAPGWFAAMNAAYGHSPVYLRAGDEQNATAVLPAFFIRSRLFGSVVTSMPFLDTGGPCGPSAAVNRSLAGSLIEEAKRLGASRVELRCTQELDLSVPASTDKVSLVLPLCDDSNHLWKQLNAKVRNQIRKAERSGLTAEIGGKDKVTEFYEIFSTNMRDLGSPVHSQRFFVAMLDAFGSAARIVIVRYHSQPIGGLVAIAFKDTVFVPWASSLKRFLSLCPNMLMYWETIRTACREGFREFDFGRSSRDSNTYRFKRQWGAFEKQLFWYTIPVRDGSVETRFDGDRHRTVFTRVWQRLPLSLTRWLGPYLRKNITL